MASRDKIIAKAEKYVSKGKIEDAIQEYDRLLKDSPNDVNTLNRIGDLWVRINRPKEAVGVFTQIADHYSRDGFFLKAIAIYKKINKLDPSQLEIYEKLAELYAKQGLAMEAKSQYLVLADYSIKQGNTAAALKTYQRIAELDPNSINIHVKLADLYQQNGQTDEALKQYDRVGRLLLKKGMYDEAVQVFQKAVKIDASNVELISSLVRALNDAGQHASAIQILETAQSVNPGDPQLAALLGQALIGKGDLGAAQSVLEEAVAANADHTATREALAQLHIRRGDVDQAFEILLPRIDALIRIDADEAVTLLNTILSADSTHPGALEKLVEAHTSANQETHAISAMNSLAEAHIARGDNGAAVTVLEKLVEREPQNEQYKKKLKFIQQQMGVAPSEPETLEETAEAPPAPEAEEIGFGLDEGAAEEISISDDGDELSLDVEESSSDMSFGLDESAALEFGLAGDSGSPAARDEAAPAATPVEQPSERTDEDLAFITEHMTEAEVFGKYGLLDRAIEHLNKVIERAPDHVPAYEKLFHTYLEEGQNDKAGELGNRFIAVLREQGDDSRAEEIVNELASRGLESESAPSGGAASSVTEESVEEPAELDEITIDEELGAPPEAAAPIEIEQEISLEIEPEAFEEEPEVEELSFEESGGIEIEETSEELSLDFEESAGLDLEPEESAAPTAEPELDLAEAEEIEMPEALELETEELELTGEAEELELVEEDSEEPEALEMSFGDEEPSSTEVERPAPAGPPPPSDEEFSEVDFYIEQDLLDEASERLEAIAANHPDDPRVRERLSIVAEKRESTASIAEPETPPALDIEAELLSAIPDDDEDVAAPAPPEPAPAEEPAPSVAAEISEEEEEGLFADEDDFFDLAAELEQELEGELDDDISLSEEEQSLEDVFREFKKGVEEQLDAEDYDTHYNLGIAYKEMGLIDEAIGEFQIASKDPKRVVECCSMLGLCFLEKGMPQLAIKWYTKGLEIPEITDEEHLGLLYELANAHVEVGDTTLAHKTFVEIYGVNSNYRDVADRIKQLENVAQ